MATYAFKAVDLSGIPQNGEIDGADKQSVTQMLKEQGLKVMALEEKKSGLQMELRLGPKRVKAAELTVMSRQLATMISSGMTLLRAFYVLEEQVENQMLRETLGAVREDIEAGLNFSDALERHPKVFSPLYVAMVRAGEAGGFLDLVLGQIAEFRTREQDLRGKVKAAMLYPVVLAGLTVVVLIFLLTYFIPKFSTIFSEFGSALPALTRFIIALSDLVKGYGLFLGIGLVVAIVLLRRGAETDAGRRRFERGVLAVPVLGGVVAHFALVRFCRMLGTLLGAGVPLVASLRVAKEAIGNQTLADTVSHAIDEVQRGQALSRALQTGGKLFPPSVIEMVAVAEETGRLDKELVRLSAAYEADLDRQLRMLVALAEPALLFVMAAVIGTIVVGMLLPVFNLQDMIK